MRLALGRISCFSLLIEACLFQQWLDFPEPMSAEDFSLSLSFPQGLEQMCVEMLLWHIKSQPVHYW